MILADTVLADAPIGAMGPPIPPVDPAIVLEIDEIIGEPRYAATVFGEPRYAARLATEPEQ